MRDEDNVVMAPCVSDQEVKREGRVGNNSEVEFGDELLGDFSAEELRDFLAADVLEVQADPAFKEGLRSRLWTLVNERYGRDGPTK